MRVRSMVGILVEHQDRILMMHRAPDRKLNPDLWGIPGGHVEPEEMNDPTLAALRELEEETGILPEQLDGFSLRYVLEDWLSRSTEDTCVRMGVYDGEEMRWSTVKPQYLTLGGKSL